jgi:hypothetical protein
MKKPKVTTKVKHKTSFTKNISKFKKNLGRNVGVKHGKPSR